MHTTHRGVSILFSEHDKSQYTFYNYKYVKGSMITCKLSRTCDKLHSKSEKNNCSKQPSKRNEERGKENSNKRMDLVEEEKKRGEEECEHDEEVSFGRVSKQRRCMGEISRRSVGADNENHPISFGADPCNLVLGTVEVLCEAIRFGVVGEEVIAVQLGDTEGHDDPLCGGVDVDVAFGYVLLEVGNFGVVTGRRVVVLKVSTVHVF